jgi:pimeloyl-ACP methyl ester carboxylesterase
MPYARCGQTTIYYEVRGTSGPPLVLIRGFASSLHTWNGVDAELARDHVTVVLDNRGVGRSDVPKGRYTTATMADDVTRVLDAAGLGPVHVLGTSLGGMIAQQLALRHPTRVRSLVLAATTAGRAGGIALRKRGVLAIALASLLPAKLRSRMATVATMSHRARRDWVRNGCRQPNPLPQSRTPLDGLIGQVFAIIGHHTCDRIAQISAPTLVIHGTADNLIHWQHAQILAGLIPAARLELWSGAGHDLAVEAPRRLALSVRQHVGEHGPASRSRLCC